MILKHLPKRAENQKIAKTLQVDERMYNRLDYLAKQIYDTNITELVCAALAYLVAHEDTIRLYQTDYLVRYHMRTYNIKKELLDALDALCARYPSLSYTALVNIAIHNLLEEEAENLSGYSDI